MKMVEHIGSGITRMRHLMIDADLPYPDFTYDGIFSVTFQRPVDFENWIEKWKEHLTINRISIIKAIHENPNVTKKKLESIIGISPTAIDNNIDFLRKFKLLKRIGGDKGGKWNIAYIAPESG